MSDQVSRIAAARLGKKPSAENPAAAAAAAAGPQGATQPAAPPQPEKKTPDVTKSEAAQAAGMTKTEGEKSSDNPIYYEVGTGEKKRKLTPEQIEGLLDRYGSVTSEWSEYQPVIGLAKEILSKTKGGDPEKLAGVLRDALLARANSGTQQMGPGAKNESSAPVGERLKKWMKDNDLTEAPPGYEENMTAIGDIRSQMGQLMGLMQQVISGSRAVGQQADATAAAASSQATQNRTVRIQNNLNQVQQELGLPDDKADDFFMFAGERGLVYEDFVDIGLLRKIAADFKGNMEGPELERLREISKRRQAFSGISSGVPSAPAASAPNPAGDRFNRMVDRAVGAR